VQVRLNCWRDGHGPGDVVELPDAEATVLIHHGAAFAYDDLDLELDKAEAAKTTGKVVKGGATLVQATGTADGKP
jgi:hypothetical protein